MAIDLVRTTAFRLREEELLGSVHVYRGGPEFRRAWELLERRWSASRSVADNRRVPYRGLATALRVLSGDFVALNGRVAREEAFVISRRPISEDELRMAIRAWEVRALGLDDEPIGRVLADLSHAVVPIAGHIHRRAGRCPAISDGAGWVWNVAVWEVAHRLATAPLDTDDGRATLRLDSDAALLTWDRLLSGEPDGQAAAMHKIVLHLITVPGVEDPVLSLQAGLVRLAPSWRETKGARYAWAELTDSAPILRARVRNQRTESGWRTCWDDHAAAVLRGASLSPLPSTDEAPSLAGALRTGYRWSPRYHAIGRGVGTWFHECVAHHARSVLGGSACGLELRTSRRSWPTRRKVASLLPLALDDDAQGRRLRLIVVYASSGTRRRVRDALAFVLGDGADQSDRSSVDDLAGMLRELEDGRFLRRGPFEVCFIKPPEARAWLLERQNEGALRAWAASWLEGLDASDVQMAAIVETDESARSGDKERSDPKHVLRALLAKRGIATQFITSASAPRPRKGRAPGDGAEFDDHAGANAVGDLLRSAGVFLRPFPEFGGGTGTVVVGVYGAGVTRATTGRGPGYVVNLVAVELSTPNAWGFIDSEGWVPVGRASAWFLGTGQHRTKLEARQRVERAVGQLPLALGTSKVILVFNARGCRRFWPCLADKSGDRAEAWMRAGDTAVVRVRTAVHEVPRPAGVGAWTEGLQAAKHTDFRPMSVVGAEGRAPTFVLSGSAVMSRGRSARASTRFAAPPKALNEDWHALGSTELLVLESGAWEPEDLMTQLAMLCRVAPTWNRTLRWPSPLHLARAVARDHPHGYFAEGEDIEEAEDVLQLRFDFGIPR